MNLRPNQERNQQAIWLIYAVLCFEIISLISSGLQLNLLYSAQQGLFITPEEIEFNDLREMIAGLLYTIVFIVSGIVFIRWFRRAYYNLHQLTPYLKHTEGSAAWAWFVPIISFYKPFQIMNELYQESRLLLLRNNIAKEISTNTLYLRLWWAMWIISNILGHILFRWSLRNDNSIEDITHITELSIFTNVLGVPLAFITIKIIKDYAKMEQLLPLISQKKGE